MYFLTACSRSEYLSMVDEKRVGHDVDNGVAHQKSGTAKLSRTCSSTEGVAKPCPPERIKNEGKAPHIHLISACVSFAHLESIRWTYRGRTGRWFRTRLEKLMSPQTSPLHSSQLTRVTEVIRAEGLPHRYHVFVKAPSPTYCKVLLFVPICYSSLMCLLVP